MHKKCMTLSLTSTQAGGDLMTAKEDHMTAKGDLMIGQFSTILVVTTFCMQRLRAAHALRSDQNHFPNTYT